MEEPPNFRGYCHEGDVFFGTYYGLASPLRRVNVIRSVLECRNRCFCNYGLPNPQQQPKAVAPTRETWVNNNHNYAWTFTVDRRNTISHATRQDSEAPFQSRLYRMNEFPGPYASHVLANYRGWDDVGISRSNLIRCGGPLPHFNLQPFDTHEFANNQELCAMQLAGGNPAANAGAYCHRSLPLSDNERVISFADDMTPRRDWTWSGNFFLTAGIRFHCWKNCICNHRTTKKNFVDPQVKMWQWLIEKNLPPITMLIGSGNLYPLGSSTDAKGKTRTDSRSGNAPTVECAATVDESCSLPWPIEILGPVPKKLINLLPPKPPATVGWEPAKVCGNDCTSNTDCGTDCLCRIPSTEEAKSLGIDPIAPPALCMDISSIFGRSLESQEQTACLCNSTYIAPACCHSRNGKL